MFSPSLHSRRSASTDFDPLGFSLLLRSVGVVSCRHAPRMETSSLHLLIGLEEEEFINRITQLAGEDDSETEVVVSVTECDHT